MDTRVNWLAVTSYNRVKGHIMWINVSLDNNYLLIIENIWKNCDEKVIIWVMHKGLWKCHEPRVTTNLAKVLDYNMVYHVYSQGLPNDKKVG